MSTYGSDKTDDLLEGLDPLLAQTAQLTERSDAQSDLSAVSRLPAIIDDSTVPNAIKGKPPRPLNSQQQLSNCTSLGLKSTGETAAIYSSNGSGMYRGNSASRILDHQLPVASSGDSNSSDFASKYDLHVQRAGTRKYMQPYSASTITSIAQPSSAYYTFSGPNASLGEPHSGLTTGIPLGANSSNGAAASIASAPVSSGYFNSIGSSTNPIVTSSNYSSALSLGSSPATTAYNTPTSLYGNIQSTNSHRNATSSLGNGPSSCYSVVSSLGNLPVSMPYYITAKSHGSTTLTGSNCVSNKQFVTNVPVTSSYYNSVSTAPLIGVSQATSYSNGVSVTTCQPYSTGVKASYSLYTGDSAISHQSAAGSSGITSISIDTIERVRRNLNDMLSQPERQQGRFQEEQQSQQQQQPVRQRSRQGSGTSNDAVAGVRQAYDAQLSRMRSELEEERRRRQATDLELRARQAELLKRDQDAASLRAACERKDQAIQQLEGSMEKQDIVRRTREQEKETVCRKLTDQVQQLRQEVTNRDTERQAVQEHVGRLESELQQLRQRLQETEAESRREADSYNQEMQKAQLLLRQESDARLKAVTEMNSLKESLKQMDSSHQVRCRQMETEFRSLQQQNHEAQQQSQQLQKVIESSSRDRQELDRVVADLKRALDNAQSDMRRMSQEIQRLEADNEDKRTALQLKEAAAEAARRKTENEWRVRTEKEVSDRLSELQAVHAQREQSLRDSARSHERDLKDRWAREKEALRRRFEQEIDARCVEFEERLRTAREENEELVRRCEYWKEQKRLAEQQKLKMAGLMQSVMQNNCQDALQLLSGAVRPGTSPASTYREAEEPAGHSERKRSEPLGVGGAHDPANAYDQGESMHHFETAIDSFGQSSWKRLNSSDGYNHNTHGTDNHTNEVRNDPEEVYGCTDDAHEEAVMAYAHDSRQKGPVDIPSEGNSLTRVDVGGVHRSDVYGISAMRRDRNALGCSSARNQDQNEMHRHDIGANNVDRNSNAIQRLREPAVVYAQEDTDLEGAYEKSTLNRMKGADMRESSRKNRHEDDPNQNGSTTRDLPTKHDIPNRMSKAPVPPLQLIDQSVEQQTKRQLEPIAEADTPRTNTARSVQACPPFHQVMQSVSETLRHSGDGIDVDSETAGEVTAKNYLTRRLLQDAESADQDFDVVDSPSVGLSVESYLTQLRDTSEGQEL